MNNGKITIQIPKGIIDECITASLVQMKGSYGSIDIRCTQVERIQHHISEIVTAVILKEVQKQLKIM